jgi:hypothetical protein
METAFCKPFNYRFFRKIQRSFEIFFMTFKFEKIFFPIKTFKEFVAQIGQSRVELWRYGTYLGVLRPPGGTLPSATTIDLSQNSKQILKVLMGKKIFSNLKVIKKISKLL